MSLTKWSPAYPIVRHNPSGRPDRDSNTTTCLKVLTQGVGTKQACACAIGKESSMLNRLSAFLYGEKAPDREQVTVIDVGCSGGVGTEWEVFGAALCAVGFDPLVSEIERLRQTEQRPNISYEAAFVGLGPVQKQERDALESSLSR